MSRLRVVEGDGDELAGTLDLCAAQRRGEWWRCTEPAGHVGPHFARSGDDALDAWTDEAVRW